LCRCPNTVPIVPRSSRNQTSARPRSTHLCSSFSLPNPPLGYGILAIRMLSPHPPNSQTVPSHPPSQLIGNSRCPIVDTWWQTETGNGMLSPLPAPWFQAKAGSAGVPHFGVVPVILDATSGVELPGRALWATWALGEGPGCAAGGVLLTALGFVAAELLGGTPPVHCVHTPAASSLVSVVPCSARWAI
jgi:hypothetical protein